jgi:septal ring factor EnvC (AmiA/AmiB activator)
MSETEHRTEPHVSTEELRAALAPRELNRRNPVLVSEHSEDAETEINALRDGLHSAPADENDLRTELDGHRKAIDAARADTIELRAALDAARGDAAELRAELAQAKAEARERRNALDKLARAGFLRRRRVLKDLSAKGVI